LVNLRKLAWVHNRPLGLKRGRLMIMVIMLMLHFLSTVHKI
jgi:hypothetical protein